jgi:ketosteroid isomerase-like protein
MKNALSVGALAVFLLPHLAQAQAARDAVITAETEFAAQAARVGSPAAFIANSTPTSSVVDNGRLATAQLVWRPRKQQPGTRLAWYPLLADVAQSGELGYTTGPWTFTQNGETMAAGDYITVWRKQPDGKWKFAIDMGIEHTALPAPAAARVPRPELFAAAATPVAVPSDAILALDHKFAQAELYAPVKTYQEYLSSEARLYYPGQLPLLGNTARVAVESLSRAYLFSETGGYLAAAGDLGYVYGTLRRPAADSKQPEETGTYLRIWRREAVAGWRIVLEVLNVTSTATPRAIATTPDPVTTPTGQARKD